MKAKNKKPKLIPPDLKRCQAEHKEGCWPDAAHFMIIGPARLVRCENKPTVIIAEKKPAKGWTECGSMSLCAGCFVAFCEQDDPNRITVREIKTRRSH